MFFSLGTIVVLSVALPAMGFIVGVTIGWHLGRTHEQIESGDDGWNV